MLEQEEFQKAMHTLGLRLSAAEYAMLFNEYDVDSSGSIDAVFVYMPVAHL